VAQEERARAAAAERERKAAKARERRDRERGEKERLAAKREAREAAKRAEAELAQAARAQAEALERCARPGCRVGIMLGCGPSRLAGVAGRVGAAWPARLSAGALQSRMLWAGAGAGRAAG